jgi:hypothetical protein
MYAVNSNSLKILADVGIPHSRHIGDWSAIILLDARYTQNSTQVRLPAW